MNLEREAMKGKLAGAKEKKLRLMNKFEALATSIRRGINTALTDIEDLEIPQLSQMWSDLEATWGEILSTRSDIDRLEKELK